MQLREVNKTIHQPALFCSATIIPSLSLVLVIKFMYCTFFKKSVFYHKRIFSHLVWIWIIDSPDFCRPDYCSSTLNNISKLLCQCYNLRHSWYKSCLKSYQWMSSLYSIISLYCPLLSHEYSDFTLIIVFVYPLNASGR